MTNLFNNSSYCDKIINYKKNKYIDLYHYQMPRYGYCFYNFDNIKLNNSSNGYIILNLNNILSIDNLKKIYKYNDLNLTDLIKYTNLFKKLNYLNKYNYHVICYLSIYNVIKYFNYESDDIIKKYIYNISIILTNEINKYLEYLNILISYQFDKFNIRNTYFNTFIDEQIKYNSYYISTNYENNKYLMGNYHQLDTKNIYRHINNNFLSCYKNNLNFINIMDFICNPIDKIFNINNLHNLNTNNTNNKINTYDTELYNNYDIINDKLIKFKKSSHTIHDNRNDNYINHKKNDNICNNIISLHNFNNNIQSKLSNNIPTPLLNNYNQYKIKLKENNDNYINTLISKLEKSKTDIGNFIKIKIKKHYNYNTLLIGLNLDLTYDEFIIKQFNNLINNNLNINKNNTNKKNNNNKETNKILDLIRFMGSNIDNINNINIIDYNINDGIDTIFNKIKKNHINLLPNIYLTYYKFSNIFKYIKNIYKYVDNIFFDFELNKHLRISLALNTYYNFFSMNNIISKKNKYNINYSNYDKLRKFIIYVNQYKSNSTLSINNCCECCKCIDKYIINYYQFKYLPYIDDINYLNTVDMDIYI